VIVLVPLRGGTVQHESADPQPAVPTERCGWDHVDPADPCPECEPAPAATGNPTAEASDDAVSRGYRQAHDIVMAALERNERNRQARAGKAAAGLPETMTQPVSFDATIDPPAGKAATGERHEFVPDEKGYVCLHGLARGDVGWIACFRPADAAVHHTTTEDNK
jgi:hypothetical protein